MIIQCEYKDGPVVTETGAFKTDVKSWWSARGNIEICKHLTDLGNSGDESGRGCHAAYC